MMKQTQETDLLPLLQSQLKHGYLRHCSHNVSITLCHWPHDDTVPFTLEIVDLDAPDDSFYMVTGESLQEILEIFPLNLLSFQFVAHCEH